MANTRSKKNADSTQDRGKGIAAEVPVQKPSKKKRGESSGTRRKDTAPKDISKLPPVKRLYEHLNKMTWIPTKFGDSETLAKLGMLEDVRNLLHVLHLEGLISMAHPTHRDVASQFLASLEVTRNNHELYGESSYGILSYRINGEDYQTDFEEIEEIFGFNDDELTEVPWVPGLSASAWTIMGVGVWQPGRSKSSHIGHPGLRYIHQLLANTLYARHDLGGPLTEEMRLMAWMIAQYLQLPNLQEGALVDFPRLGSAGLFANQLLYFQQWAWTTTDKNPQMRIGGLITPILMHRGIDLGPETCGYELMNISYLRKHHFLYSRITMRYAYTFYVRRSEEARVILPNTAITTLSNPENLRFVVDPSLFITEADETMDRIHASKRRRGNSSQAEIDEELLDELEEALEDEESPEHLYGSARYHFQPYMQALPPGPIRDAHGHINVLQRWNKFQDRLNMRVVQRCKDMKKGYDELKRGYDHMKAGCKLMQKQLKALTDKLSCASSSAVDASAEQPMPMQMPEFDFDQPPVARRHSYQGEGASSSAPRQRHRASISGPRYSARYSPELPDKSSSNESPSLSSPPPREPSPESETF